MDVSVRASGLVGKSLGYNERRLSVRDEYTVGELIKELNLSINPRWLLFVVSGKKATWRTILQDGDVIDVLPVCGGG